METTLTLSATANKKEIPSSTDVQSIVLMEREIPCVIKSKLDRETVVAATPSGFKLTRKYNTYKNMLELELPNIESNIENAEIRRNAKQIVTLAISDRIKCLKKLPKSKKKNVRGPMKISFSTEELALYLRLALDASDEFICSLNV